MPKKLPTRSIVAQNADELKQVAHLGEIYGLVYCPSDHEGLLLFLIAEVDQDGEHDPERHEVLARISVSCLDPEWMAISGPPNSSNPALIPYPLMQMVHSLVNDPAEFVRFFGTTDTGEA